MSRRITDLDIGSMLNNVYARIRNATEKRSTNIARKKPRLVAVSKTKPKEMVILAYKWGQRHFGENYIQELRQKALDPEVREKCKDIQWHFIGHLQRNKVNKLVGVPNLYMVETVDSEKIADVLNKNWEKLQHSEKLKVLVEINTSREKNKTGIDPDKVCHLVSHILGDCPSLDFAGLMTIGSLYHDLSLGPNPDFQYLIKCANETCIRFGLNFNSIELSMGMSGDYEHAIEVGSTNVRIGNAIFGARNYSKKHVK